MPPVRGGMAAVPRVSPRRSENSRPGPAQARMHMYGGGLLFTYGSAAPQRCPPTLAAVSAGSEAIHALLHISIKFPVCRPAGSCKLSTSLARHEGRDGDQRTCAPLAQRVFVQVISSITIVDVLTRAILVRRHSYVRQSSGVAGGETYGRRAACDRTLHPLRLGIMWFRVRFTRLDSMAMA